MSRVPEADALPLLATRPRRVSRAIVIQVVVVSVLALVELVLAVTGVVAGDLGLGWAIGGLLGGAVVGVVASRTKLMQWDERAGQVVSKTDWLGGVMAGPSAPSPTLLRDVGHATSWGAATVPKLRRTWRRRPIRAAPEQDPRCEPW